MKTTLMFVLAAVLLSLSVQLRADNRSFIYSETVNGPVLCTEDRSCYICQRTSSDFYALPRAVAAGYQEELISIKQDRDALVQNLLGQYSEIVNGIKPQDKGALDFSIATVSKDMPAFSKKIPKLQTIKDYASKEGIPSDASLLEVLDLMKDGKSRTISSLDVSIAKLEHKVDFLLRIAQEVASESFVSMDLSFAEILKVDAAVSTPEMKTLYDNWIRLNRAAIESVRNAYAKYSRKDDGSEADRQLEALLKTTSTATPASLQQALRTGILFELAGSPEGTVRVRVCPICRVLLESLNDKISKRYLNDDFGAPDGIFSNYGAR
jgi:hypothetical protein